MSNFWMSLIIFHYLLKFGPSSILLKSERKILVFMEITKRPPEWALDIGHLAQSFGYKHVILTLLEVLIHLIAYISYKF